MKRKKCFTIERSNEGFEIFIKAPFEDWKFVVSCASERPLKEARKLFFDAGYIEV